MKKINVRVLLLTLGCWLLISCSLEIPPSQESENIDAITISMQQYNTTPKEGAKLIDKDLLYPGDILLSRSTGFRALGVILATNSSVSHASIYLGNNQVAEAIGTGIQIIPLNEAIEHSLMTAVFRYPGLTQEHAELIHQFAYTKVGAKYNYKGIMLMAPYMLTRQVCILPPLTETFRYSCMKHLATLHIGSPTKTETQQNSQSFFCSQFVLEAYNHAGMPITDSAAVWVSPADLLHMREGDINSISSFRDLIYIGHLKSS